MDEVQNTSKRVGEIEFLRFVFSIIIVFHHSRNFIGNETSLFLNGAFAVEFFFVLSGLLMMKSISGMKTQPKNLGVETAQFIKKKYLSLCPDMIISWIIGVVATAIVYRGAFRVIGKILREGIWELGLFTMTGIRMTTVNDAVWYLSSMLLCMAIIYPILRKYNTVAKWVIIPLLTLLIFGYFVAQTKSLRSPFGWAVFTYRGNLRAFADLGVGIMVYQITEWFKGKDLTVLSKALLTVVKYIGVVFLVLYMYFIRTPSVQNDMFGICVIAVVIALIFSRQTYGERFFNNGFVGFLGKFSLPLYLSHYYWADLLKLLPSTSFSNATEMVMYFILSFTTAALVMFISNLIKKFRPFSKIKPLFLK